MPDQYEGAELVGQSGRTYLTVSPLGQPNVWTAVAKDDYSNIFVIKSPSESDNPDSSWPLFVHEMIMHELFKDSLHIRGQIDRIPPGEGTDTPPMLVLELLETTVWKARTERPFSREEIVAVLQATLLALEQIHAQGLVYGDLKMENIMLSGFDADNISDGSNFVVKLADLGTVIPPSRGTCQPLVYRAPEVYFKEEITPAADIWALGLIYTHLLEAQGNLSKAGLYDEFIGEEGDMSILEHHIRSALASDYDLHHHPYYEGCPLPERRESHPKGGHWDALRIRGLEELDVAFIRSVMKADPSKRPSAKMILDSQWIKSGLLARQFKDMGLDGVSDNSLSHFHLPDLRFEPFAFDTIFAPDSSPDRGDHLSADSVDT